MLLTDIVEAQNPPKSTGTADKKAVLLRSELFKQTAGHHAQKNPKVAEKLRAFLQHKMSTPLAPFGAADYPYKGGGPLQGIRHAHLTHDISVVYTISGTPPTIKLYGVFTHDESGTGTPPNVRRQKQLVTQFSNQRFSENFLQALKRLKLL